ncbi:hypothetical protein [Sorangium sp. So ce1182]|uniref:hypothetical protein n=1 Tax=Sorangium sp. So ce1182 TaxID=3133334 RepID=UPI003F5EDC54
MASLERLEELIEASDNADIARGAASALHRKLKHASPGVDDEDYLNALEDLLRRQSDALRQEDATMANPSARHLRDVGERYLPQRRRRPAALNQMLSDLQQIRANRADRDRVLSVLAALEDLMQAWLDAGFQARSGARSS